MNWVAFSLSALEQGYDTNQWATLNQWNKLGRQVAKGHRSTRGVVWVTPSKDRKRTETNADSPQGATSTSRFPKVFGVFNVDQLSDDPTASWQKPTQNRQVVTDEEIERFVAASGASIRHSPTARASYVPEPDVIMLPPIGQFDSTGDYYSTALHDPYLPHRCRHTGDRRETD